MFCNHCGTEIVGSNRFCSNCGAEVQRIAAAPAPRPVTVAPEKSWPEVFREGWRSFVSAPLVLAMIICFSVVQLLNLFSMDSVMDTLGILGGSDDSGMGAVINEITSKLETLGFLALLPGILMAVGMWMIYIDSFDHSKEPIKTAGFTLIQTIYILELTALTFMMIFLLASLSTLEKELGTGAVTDVVSTVRASVIFVVVIVDVIFGLVISMLAKMRQTAVDCDVQGAGLAYAIGILTIISGIISVISLLSAGITLAGLANCAYTLLLGIVLCRYKHTMEELEYIHRTRNFGRSSVTRGPGAASAYPGANTPSPNVQQPVQDNGYIPTWKRIQMNESAIVPEVQKSMPEQPATPAKKCLECGTTQSGDNQVCFYCGAEL